VVALSFRYLPAAGVLVFVVLAVQKFEVFSATCLAMVTGLALGEVVFKKTPHSFFLDDALNLPTGSTLPAALSLAAFIPAALHFGMASAERKTEFMVLSGQPNTVVLTIEGEDALAATFDRATKKLLPERHVLPAGSLRFQWEPVGPLSPQ